MGRASAAWSPGVAARRASSPLLGPLFTGDAAVRDLLVPVLLVAALGQPVAGVVFVLDGVLIGAGDGRYLAWAGLLALAVYAPVALLVAAPSAAAWSLVWVRPVGRASWVPRLRGAGAPGPRRRVAGDRDPSMTSRRPVALGEAVADAGAPRRARPRRATQQARPARAGGAVAGQRLETAWSGGDDVERHRGGHLVVQLDRHLVGAERLDRVGRPRSCACRPARPTTSASAPAISATVTAPNRRPPAPARTLTLTGCASSLALISSAWSWSRTARARAGRLDRLDRSSRRHGSSGCARPRGTR